MNAYITSKQELADVLRQVIKEEIKKELPSVVRKASRKEIVTTNELCEITGLTKRQLQYLRDKRRIPFSKEGRTILYKMEDVEAYLERTKIDRWK